MPTPLADIAKIPDATVESIVEKNREVYGDAPWSGPKRADYIRDLRAALANARKNKNAKLIKSLLPYAFVKDVFNGAGASSSRTPKPDFSYPGEQDLLETFGDVIEWGDLALVEALYDAPCHSMHSERDPSREVSQSWFVYKHVLSSSKVIPDKINQPCNRKKQTPLMVAAEHGRTSIIKFLLQKGRAICSIRNVADKNQTALVYAVSHKYDQAARDIIGYALHRFADSDFKYLIDHDQMHLITLMIAYEKAEVNNQNLKLLFDKKRTDLVDCMVRELPNDRIQEFIENPRNIAQEKEYRLYLRYILNCRHANRLSDEGKAVIPSGKAVAPDGKAMVLDGKAMTLDGKAAIPDGKAIILDGKATKLMGVGREAIYADSKAAANALNRNDVNFRNYFIRQKKDKYVCLMIRHKKVEPKGEDFLPYFNDNCLESLDLILAELSTQAIQEMLVQQQEKQPAYCSYLKYILAIRELEGSKRTEADYRKLVVAIMQVDDSVKFTAKYAAEIRTVCGEAQSGDTLVQLEDLASSDHHACMKLAYQCIRGTDSDLFKAHRYMKRAARIFPGCMIIADQMAAKVQQLESKQMPPPPVAPSAGSVNGLTAAPSAPPLFADQQVEGQASAPSAPPAAVEGVAAPSAPPAEPVKNVPAPSAAPAAITPALADQPKAEAKLAANVFELAEQLKEKAQFLPNLADALKLQEQLISIQQIVNKQMQLLAPGAAKTEKVLLPFFNGRAPVINPMAPLSSDPRCGARHTAR